MFPAIVACARISGSATAARAAASGSGMPLSSPNRAAAPMRRRSPSRSIRSIPARRSSITRSARSRPDRSAGITSVAPPTTVIAPAAPNARFASSGEVGIVTSICDGTAATVRTASATCQAIWLTVNGHIGRVNGSKSSRR